MRLYLVRSEPDKIQVARAPKIRIQIRRWLTTLPQLHRFRGSDSKEAPLAPLRNIQNPDFRFQIPDSRFRGSRYQIPDSRVREEHSPHIPRNQDSDSKVGIAPSRRSDAQKSDTTVARALNPPRKAWPRITFQIPDFKDQSSAVTVTGQARSRYQRRRVRGRHRGAEAEGQGGAGHIPGSLVLMKEFRKTGP